MLKMRPEMLAGGELEGAQPHVSFFSWSLHRLRGHPDESAGMCRPRIDVFQQGGTYT
jgi:hypothetical protein